jgi:3-phytase
MRWAPSSLLLLAVACAVMVACTDDSRLPEPAPDAVIPQVITEPVPGDADDPAIWINSSNFSESLVFGTDKIRSSGGLYAFSLDGNIVESSVVAGLDGPNNVDILHDIFLDGVMVDIAVVTERAARKLRIFSVPDMTPLDAGGLPVFVEEPNLEPMGVALYQRPSDDALFVILSSKSGDSGEYLWQYLLEGDGSGQFVATLVRRFGLFSGSGEIEAIAVDQELGYVYYSDERYAVRKYHADPDNGDDEIALIGRNEDLVAAGSVPFLRDREGIAIYSTGPGTGYILVSDQHALRLQVYPREGVGIDLHHHPQLAAIPVASVLTDGIEATSLSLSPQFPQGMLVMMSEDRSFHLYHWGDIQARIDAAP